jgi:hypothetical protein
MRLALLSLTAAAVATVAFAQEAPAPAAPPAVAPMTAAPAPAPAADPMAMPMPAPAAPAAEVPPPPPPPQELAPLPTDPLGIAIIDTIEKVCVPSVAGGDLAKIAKANGFVMKKKLWTKAMAVKPYQIVVQPKSSANPTTCTLTIDLPIDGAQGLVTGLHGWASRHDPILQLRSPYSMDYPGVKRTTVSWETTVAGPFTGMSFASMKKTNGQPLLKAADQAELLYQTR